MNFGNRYRWSNQRLENQFFRSRLTFPFLPAFQLLGGLGVEAPLSYFQMSGKVFGGAPFTHLATVVVLRGAQLFQLK